MHAPSPRNLRRSRAQVGAAEGADHSNQLLAELATLAPDEAEWLATHLEPVTLAQTDVLVKAGEAYAHVFFPDTFIASVISRMLDGRAVEVGTVGGEGMVGVDVFLGGRVSDYDIVAQIAGTGRRANVAVLAETAEKHPALRRLLNRCARAYLGQVAQTAACNRLHGIEQRCARWLLMTHDRVGGTDRIRLTQDYLAVMLGVRRAGVALAARALKDAGLIRYSRGSIQIVDRAGLEAAACECYASVRRHLDREE